MEEYYFLFAAALVYALVAAIYDLRTREVPNWLNFSLIAVALSYRLFFSLYYGWYQFILYGLLGFLVFYLLANLFYYAKVFAGGDAKLLMGIGCILPFESFGDFFFIGIGFIFILFAVGSVYSLAYSIFLAGKNYSAFKPRFIKKFRENGKLFIFSLIFIILLLGETIYFSSSYVFFLCTSLFLLIVPGLYIYLKAVESSCMIKLVSSKDATEGDWLEKDVRVGNRVIRKSVHGLSKEEIKILRKYGKKIWIKYGIPFVPAFFLALAAMVFFFLFAQADIQSFFYYLF